jgi:hypothetical protein
MDQISLALCCTKPPADQIRPVLTRPGGKTVTLRVTRSSPTELLIAPWPFGPEQVEVSTNFRRLADGPCENVEVFHRDYAQAKDERLDFILRAG